MNKKILNVWNPHQLPTMPFHRFHDFQDDLKEPITRENLETLKQSLIDHGVFVPKFVWFFEDIPYTLDGHQTKKALSALEDEGWTIPEIPYVAIQARNKKHAAELLAQINSQYAKLNPQTTFFQQKGFTLPEIKQLARKIRLPNIDLLSLPVAEEPHPPNTRIVTENIESIRQIHVLLSFPVDKYPDVFPLLKPLEALEYLEYRQSGN